MEKMYHSEKWQIAGSIELLLRVPQVQMEANSEVERSLSVHELYSVQYKAWLMVLPQELMGSLWTFINKIEVQYGLTCW